MPLFHIQDSDRPAYVYAESYAKALEKWTEEIKRENDGEAGEPSRGISHICDDDELIIGDRFLA
jgi:hypothetical protein